MAETKFQCPFCGRIGSTTREIPPGASARCPGCRGSFNIKASEPLASSLVEASEPSPALPINVAQSELHPRETESERLPVPSIESTKSSRRLRMALAIGIGSGVLVTSLGIGVGYFVLRNSSPESVSLPETVARETLTTEEVASRCEASVGVVFGGSSSGTGFLVADGLLATNAHVIDSIPPDQIKVTFPAATELDRGPIVGRVVYFDQNRDLAILRVSTRLPPLKTAANHKFRRGQDVVVIGNPGVGRVALECVVSRGVLGSKIDEESLSYYQLSGSINPGNSGGPVLDLTGRVVGVVTLKARNQEGLGFCIPAGDLAKATRDAASQPSPAARLAAQRHAESAKDDQEPDNEFTAAMKRTDPATWIAMLDAGKILDDQAPESVKARKLLDYVDQLYEEDRQSIAAQVIRMVVLLRRKKHVITGYEFLQGSLDWTSPSYFKRGAPVEFALYFQLYETSSFRHDTHDATLASVRSYHQAYMARIDPPARTNNQPTSNPERVAQPDRPLTSSGFVPERPITSKLSSSSVSKEILRLARSLEQQKKIRGALRYYRDLVDDHPGTTEATEATERIKALTPSPSFGNRPPINVINVLDNMTILVDFGGAQKPVRLLGLDPFPKNHSVSSRGTWENQSRAFLESLIQGRSIYLDYERGVSQFDGEGRILAYLYRADDKLAINREVIARGYGIGSKFGMFSQAEDFRDADARARSRKIGLWAP